MLKKIFLLLFVFLFICFAGFITVSAEETTTEQITDVETTTEAVTELPAETTEHNIDDIYNILFYVLIGIGVVGGCLIAQGFSFWKW